MKQRLIKCVVCACLAVSVFLCSGGTALAEDYDVQLDVSSGGAFRVDFAVDNISDATSIYSVGTLDCRFSYSVDLAGGYIYNGYLSRLITIIPDYSNSSVSYSNYIFKDIVVPSPLDGVTVTFRLESVRYDSLAFYIYLNFDDVYIRDTRTLHGISVLSFEQQATFASSVHASLVSYGCSVSVAGDTLGHLDASLPGDVNLGGVVSDNAQQQMQQQQQIAQQQQQQSAQQHEDMKTGFQDDTYNSHVSSAGSQIDSYISQESALMDQQQNRVQDFAADNFNTGLINTYMPAIAAVSGWYTQLWNSFGQFNGAFVAILSLGVAALIIGLRRR